MWLAPSQPPKDLHILMSRTCDCHLVGQKGLWPKRLSYGSWDVEIVLAYPGGANVILSGLRRRREREM